ncbi:SAM-dependent methyltransferase [Alteromonas mediterranea]|uniref:class I SAM-dependent methyltransferase n=1 Tax=Alteromonas mediterranea TaxID=314275 RepID=UPI000903CAB6|nr:methyltransferase domain-containing protein [Alteromonas mediterranea]APE01669.1 SAM-dependent methyltransferase [Alteromonas mediterranea]
MHIRKPLPSNRTYEQVFNHYQVEKNLASQLKAANRESRKEIYSKMYDELFSKVPDHPRLTKRNDETESRKKVSHRMAFIKRFLKRDKVFVEFASGDGRLLKKAAQHCRQAIGVDISDQRDKSEHFPENTSVVVYDGYDLSQIENESVDFVFSDQLIEHLHDEDVAHHFAIVNQILKKGGVYAFRTPHAFCGPHDVSQYFSNDPECFHLKEWTFEDVKSIEKNGFEQVKYYWSAKSIHVRMPRLYFLIMEKLLKNVDSYKGRKIAQLFLPSVTCVLVK